jgi:hypothetical protein
VLNSLLRSSHFGRVCGGGPRARLRSRAATFPVCGFGSRASPALRSQNRHQRGPDCALGLQLSLFAALAREQARPSEAKIVTGAWLMGNANFLRFSRARPAVARVRSRGPVGAFKSPPPPCFDGCGGATLGGGVVRRDARWRRERGV